MPKYAHDDAVQEAVILAAIRRLHPKCGKLRVVHHKEDGRWFVHDPESRIWWLARPGQADRGAGYVDRTTVAFDRIVWVRGEAVAESLVGEMRDRIPEEDEAPENFLEGW